MGRFQDRGIRVKTDEETDVNQTRPNQSRSHQLRRNHHLQRRMNQVVSRGGRVTTCASIQRRMTKFGETTKFPVSKKKNQQESVKQWSLSSLTTCVEGSLARLVGT